MGVYNHEHEFTSTISHTRLFKTTIFHGDDIIPKFAPHAIKHVQKLNECEGPGTIKKVTFGKERQFRHVQHQVDSIDHENLTYCHSLINGNHDMFQQVEKISYKIMVVASSCGGSTVKITTTFHTREDVEIHPDHVQEGKEKGCLMFRMVRDYLCENPSAYECY